MNAFSERVPPHNLEAEQSVLGAMLIDRAFRNNRNASAQFGDADLPVMMAAAAAQDRLHEVHLG